MQFLFLVGNFHLCVLSRDTTLSNSMVYSASGGANSCLPTQELSPLLWNQKITVCSKDPLFSRINPDHIFSSYLFKTHFSIILASRRKSSYVIFSSGCFDQDLMLNSHLSHLCFTLHHPHLPWSDHPTALWRRIQNISISLCSFLQSSITFSIISPNSLLSTL